MMINVFQPALGAEELDGIAEVFHSNWLGKGKRVTEFERNFASFLRVPVQNVKSTNSCTEGLFSSMKILGVDENDEVILPSISFVGAANAICANNSKLVFCDSDPHTLNVTANDIEKRITKNTKAVILLHYGGRPCDMDEILSLARQYNIDVVEDSACSVASRYKGRACGTLGDIGTWSFDAMKILVCGDGGMIYVKDEEKAVFAEKLMYFGLESQSGFSNTVDSKWWEFEISQFGHRSIMNDITASMALIQLGKLRKFIARRQQIYNIYNNELQKVTWLKLPEPIPEDCESSYYFYHIQTKNDKRDELALFLRNNGIYTTFRYYPLHWVSYYGCKGETYPNAEYAACHTLCLPLHQSLSDDDVQKVIDTIYDFSNKYHL